MAFKINFSDDELNPKSSRSYEAGRIPTGDYTCNITDVTLAEVKSGPNKGNPLYRVEFTIADGYFAKAKVWANVMLFDLGPDKNWFLAQFLKATGFPVSSDIPAAEDFLGKEVMVSIVRKYDKWASDKAGNDARLMKNEVKGFVFDDGTAPAGATVTRKRNSLLPS